MQLLLYVLLSFLGRIASDEMVISKGLVVKEFADCDLWAEKDGECLHNPNFMWTKCHSSCIEYARDLNERCREWADEGECTNNPRFIHLNCPESCGLSVSWSPFVRRSLEMDRLPVITDLTKDPCAVPQDVLSAAHIMKHRLRSIIFFGGASSVPGITFDAPSEYLAMLGLAEAFLYTMRLYSVAMDHLEHQIVSHFESSHNNKENGESVADNARQAMKKMQKVHTDNLVEISNTITDAHYQSDLLTRHLPRWMQHLDTAAEATFGALRIFDQSIPLLFPPAGLLGYDPCGPSVGPGLTSLPTTPHWDTLGFGQHHVEHTIGFHSDSPGQGQGLGQVSGEHVSRDLLSSSIRKLSLKATKVLNNGVSMPVIGLGTWQLDGRVCEEAVYEAIKLGYRHIDSAEAYRNEEQVGFAVQRAINEGLVKREDLFLATKLSDESHAGYDKTTALVHRQLKAMKVTYFDLYMLHSPLPSEIDRHTGKSPQAESWRALEDLVDQGLIRSLGVSNFDEHELRRLMDPPDTGVGLRHRPSVVQNKIDPYHVGKQLDNKGDGIIAYARSQDVLMVAYSPFSAYPFAMKANEDPIVRYVATAYTKYHNLPVPVTGAQVVLRWALQKGFSPIPRSSTSRNLRENLHTLMLPPLPPSLLAMMDGLQFLVASSVSKAVAV